MLHSITADPVDPGVVADGLVEGVHHDHLVPLVHRVRGDPVGVQDTEAAAFAADALLGDTAEVPRSLVLLDAAVHGLAIDDALGNAALATAALHTDAVNAVTLLCLVADLARFVGARRARGPVDRGELPELPSAHAREEAHHVRLLLSPAPRGTCRLPWLPAPFNFLHLPPFE